MACSLILHKKITTTVAKAKALKMYAEPLITKSKEDTTHNRRIVFSNLKSKFAVTELFREISPKIADRPGGYTRILKLGSRSGDSAEMCIIELVDYNENMLAAKDDKKTASRRRRGGAKKATDAAAPKAKAEKAGKVEDAKVVEDVVEVPVEETAPVVDETPEVKEALDSEEDKKEE